MTQTPRKLTEEELALFRRDGFLILHHVLDCKSLNELNDELEQRYQENKAALQKAETERDNPEGWTLHERLNNIHELGATSERSQALSRDPRIVSLIEDLVAPGVALFSAKLISKGPNEPDNVCHWHQDEAYWFKKKGGDTRVSVWVPLKDTSKEDGCLRVVPATHRDGIVDHLPRSSRDHGACRLSFLPGEEELPGALYCEIPAGSVVLFSNKVYHSSLGNHTDHHRRAFILTYQSALASEGKDRDFRILRSVSADR